MLKKAGSKQFQKNKGFSGAILIVLEGHDKGAEFELTGEFSIGRTTNNTLIRKDRGISRNHAVIKEQVGVYTLEDLGSSNGTRLNGRKISMIEVLKDGDKIGIGEAVFLFLWPEGKINEGDITSPGTILDEREIKETPKKLSTKLKILIVLLIVLSVTVAVAYYLKNSQDVVLMDNSDEPIEYSENDDFYSTAYGYGNNDKTHPDKVIILFEYLKGRVTLFYSASHIDKAKELEISLNGQKIAYTPLTSTYRYDIQLELPRKLLSSTSFNKLIFDNTLNPPRNDEWEIAYIKIEQSPLLPANPEEASREYQIGMRLFNERNVDPSNLYTAQQHFIRVRDLLEQLDPKPGQYDDSIEMIDQIGQELQKIFDEGVFSAERAYRYGNIEKSKEFLQRTRSYFPLRRDTRHKQLTNYIENLEEIFGQEKNE